MVPPVPLIDVRPASPAPADEARRDEGLPSNVVPFVRPPRRDGETPDPRGIIPPPDRCVPPPPKERRRLRLFALLVVSLLVHGALVALLPRELAPLPSVELPAISVDLIIGTEPRVNAAPAPGKDEPTTKPTTEETAPKEPPAPTTDEAVAKEPEPPKVEDTAPPKTEEAAPKESPPPPREDVKEPPPPAAEETAPKETPPPKAEEAAPKESPYEPSVVMKEPTPPAAEEASPKESPPPPREEVKEPPPPAKAEEPVKREEARPVEAAPPRAVAKPPEPAPPQKPARPAPPAAKPKKPVSEAKPRTEAPAKKRGQGGERSPNPADKPQRASNEGRGAKADPNYSGSVAAHLARYKQYPADARANRSQGVATVSFGIDGAGRVTSVRLVRGTGVASLDQEAQAMPRRASPFPAPPTGRPMTFTVPVSFSMR